MEHEFLKQTVLLNDLMKKLASMTMMLKESRDSLIKDGEIDSDAFKRRLEISDIGTQYLYLVGMIQGQGYETRSEYFSSDNTSFDGENQLLKNIDDYCNELKPKEAAVRSRFSLLN